MSGKRASTSSSFSERGTGAGFGCNVNIPLPEGLSDADLFDVLTSTLEIFSKFFQPNYLVLAIGADGFANDPLVTAVDGGWNLTSRGIAACAEATITHVTHSSTASTYRHNMKCIVLGGGGYSDVNTARTFVACTAAACGSNLPHDVIPSLDDFILRYSPDFLLHTLPNNNNSKVLSTEYQDGSSKAKVHIQVASDYIKSKDQYKTFDEIKKQDAVW